MSTWLEAGFDGGRKEFGVFLNGLCLGAGFQAVEVGTHRGEFAAQLLESWHGDKLWCVDPYLSGYDPMDPVSGRDREGDLEAALDALEAHDRKRWDVLVMTSAEAVRRFEDGLLAFVYVDGNHQPDHVAADLRAWWPKVVPGGVLAGHDLVCANEVTGGWGRLVQPVVMAFAVELGLPVKVVAETCGMPWSFYLEKPR